MGIEFTHLGPRALLTIRTIVDAHFGEQQRLSRGEND